MSNNTGKQTDKQELNSWQKLHKQLDDTAFAYEFKEKTFSRAKAMIGDILSVTMGSAVVTEHNNEWGHAIFLELLTMFQIRHKNFSRSDFAENLQEFLYTWTIEHDTAVSDWQEKLFAKRRLDKYGLPIEAEQPNITNEPQVEQPTIEDEPLTLTQHHLQIMANKIAHVLQSDKVSDDIKIAFQSILCEMSTSAQVGIDSPELVKTSFPLLVNTLDSEYGKGIIHALRAVLDTCLPASVEDELRQYEKRFDGKTQDELKVLDLSKSSVEDLAVTLSGLMHNPNLPKPIKDCLEDNLNVSHTDFYTPENILGNLKEMSEE